MVLVNKSVLTGMMVACFSMMVALPASAAENTNTSDAPRADGKVKLSQNFQNVDIRKVIEAVAKLTGKNFIIDSRVKGKVTLIAPEAMSPDALYETLLAILRVHNYAAVEGKSAIRVVPVGSVKDQVPYNDYPARVPSSWVTEVIPVKNMAANKVVAALRPLVAREGYLASLNDNNSNAVIVTDTRANLKRIKQILKRVDINAIGGYEVVPVTHGSAEDMVKTLKNLLPKGVTGETLKMSFDERSNRIILAGSPQQRTEVRALIADLDIPVKSAGRVQVVYLRYAKAKDLVPVLQKISTNRSLLNSVNGAEAGVGGAKATPAKGLSKVAQLDSKDLKERISIEADERTNAIVISAPPSVVGALRDVVKQLDIRRAQVLIEAILVEVSEAKAAELGVEWVANGPNGVGMINFSGTIPAIIGAVSGGTASQAASSISKGVTTAVGEISADGKGWGALIRALNSDNDSNVLATPSILTLDNEEAEIIVGKEVPFQTGSYTTNTTGASNPFTTVERKEVGLKLKVKPQINEGSEVFLEVDQEVSSVLPADGAVDLQTSKRQIKTNIIVADGNMIVLGGLLDERETEVTSKVPGLGDIPLLGGLFRSKQNKREKVNLMIFLRTVIVKDNTMSEYYSNKKYSQLRSEQRDLLNKDTGMLEGLRPYMPSLQEWKEGKPASPYVPENSKENRKAEQEAKAKAEEAADEAESDYEDDLLGL